MSDLKMAFGLHPKMHSFISKPVDQTLDGAIRHSRCQISVSSNTSCKCDKVLVPPQVLADSPYV